MPIVPNIGYTITLANTGPQANVPGLHTPRGTLTEQGATTFSTDQTVEGVRFTGALTVNAHVRFIDCQFTRRITCRTENANINTRSVTMEWCLLGDPTIRQPTNPGFITGNIYMYRTQSIGWQDHLQIKNGTVHVVECIFDQAQDQPDSGQPDGTSHPDFIQTHYVDKTNLLDDTTLQEVIIQDSRFRSYCYTNLELPYAHDGETTAPPESRAMTSVFCISNPGASRTAESDNYRRNQNTWYVIRGCYSEGWASCAFFNNGRTTTNQDQKFAVIDNIITSQRHSSSGSHFSTGKIDNGPAEPRTYWARNQNANGDFIAKPNNTFYIDADASTAYPRVTTWDTPGSGGGGGGGTGGSGSSGTQPPSSQPIIGSTTDGGSDSLSGLSGDFVRGYGPIALPSNSAIRLGRFYWRGDGQGSGGGSSGGTTLWTLTGGDAATALPSNGGGNRAVGNITTVGGRAVASIRKNANGTMGWHTAYRSSTQGDDSLANGLIYSGSFRLDNIPENGQQWIAYYLSITADETAEFGQSSNNSSLGFLIGVHPPSALYLIRKNSDGSQTQVATGVDLPSNLNEGVTDLSWTFTITATTATIDFNGTELSGNHGLAWSAARWYQQYQNSDTAETFQVSFTDVTATTITGGSTGASQLWKGVWYSDNGGNPGEVIAVTNESSVSTSDAADSILFADPATETIIDTTEHPSIHLGIHSGATANVGQLQRLNNDTTYNFWFGDDTYTGGTADNPTVTTSTDAYPRIFCEYQTLGKRRFVSGARGAGERSTGTIGEGESDSQTSVGWSLAGWSAANTHVRTANERVSMSFVPDQTGTMSEFWFFIRTAGSACDSSDTGYGAGNSGICHVELYLADSTTGLPSGGVLYEESFNPCDFSSGVQAACYISPNLAVTAGQHYVAVFSNTDAAPGTNWFSLNCGSMEDAGLRPDLEYVGLRPGERVRSSDDGGVTWTETGLYGTMLPTYLIEYQDESLQGIRTRTLWGDGSYSETDVTIEYYDLAGRTITGLGAYSKTGGGTSTLELIVNSTTVRSGEVTTTGAYDFGRVDFAAYTVPDGATVEVRSNGTIEIFRSGTESGWGSKIDNQVTGEYDVYSYSVYPFVVV